MLSIASTDKGKEVPVELYARLQEIVADARDDFEAFYQNNNKAAGTRVRKAMQEIKGVAQEIRVDVQARKNAPSE